MPEIYGDSLFQAMEKQPVELGSLLIAAPDLEMDTDWLERTVHIVFSIEPGKGVLTLMLTARRDDAVANILPELDPIVAPPKAVFTGGYNGMQLIRTLGILNPGVNVEDALAVDFIYEHIGNRVVILDGAADAQEIKKWVSTVRLFVGQIEWNGNRLQEEIDEGKWFVADSLASDVIAGQNVDLWAEALRRQPLPLPLFATVPLDYRDN